MNQAYSIWSTVQQDQTNPGIYTVMSQQTQQAQMETSHPQVQVPQQQIGDVRLFTSTGPVISSRTLVPSPSHTSVALCSHTPQSTTVHTPMTTVQYSQQQHLLCDNSAITTSSSLSSSQVHTQMV